MRNSMQHFSILIFTLLIFSVLACSTNDDEKIVVVEVNSTPFSITIQAENTYTGSLNQSFQLTAIVRNSEGEILNNQVVSWLSSDTSVATITSNGSLLLVSNGQTTITASIGTIEDSKTINIELISNDLIVFSVSELSDQLSAQGGTSLIFLDESTMSSSFMELSPGESTDSSTVDRDQVYYFFEGNVIMNIEGQVVNIEEESAVFIAANSSRSITSVTTNSRIIITELKLVISQTQEPFSIFTRAEMEAPRNPNQNVWNPFLNEGSVIFGLYMLPQLVGGDNRLVHGFDELNIITRGSSRFETDEGDVQVEPGSLVFVREGNGHAFNMLNSDIDILILWNK